VARSAASWPAILELKTLRAMTDDIPGIFLEFREQEGGTSGGQNHFEATM